MKSSKKILAVVFLTLSFLFFSCFCVLECTAHRNYVNGNTVNALTLDIVAWSSCEIGVVFATLFSALTRIKRE